MECWQTEVDEDTQHMESSRMRGRRLAKLQCNLPYSHKRNRMYVTEFPTNYLLPLGILPCIIFTFMTTQHYAVDPPNRTLSCSSSAQVVSTSAFLCSFSMVRRQV